MARTGGSSPTTPTGRADDRSSADHTVMVDAGAATAVGGRRDNQDRYAVSTRWGVLSDGAGGVAGGARAAELTVSTVAAGLEPSGPVTEEVVVELIGRANAAVRAERETDAAVAAMAATVTVAVATDVRPDASDWLVANLGDSPAWLVTPGGSRLLSQEHNLAGELLRAGVLSPDEARHHPGRHQITRAVGGGEDVVPALATVTVPGGGAVVLASDGVTVLDDEELAAVVLGAPTAAAAATAAVDAAVARGATDNVTVVVLRHLPSFGSAPASR